MTTSVRYKSVDNTTGAALTVANFPSHDDGNDKQIKFIKRYIENADVGVGAGQLGHALGAILDVVPTTTNVLWIEGFLHRPAAAVQGMIPYDNLLGKTFPVQVPLTQVQVQFALGLDNTIRAIDICQGGTAAIVAGDIITAILILGPKFESGDSMN